MARVLARNGRTRIGAGRRRRRRRRASARRSSAGCGARSRAPASMPRGLSFVLVSDAPEILPSFPAAFRARFRAVLAARGIAGRQPARRSTRVEAGRLLLDGHAPVEADEILWTTQAAPARWLARDRIAARFPRLSPGRRHACASPATTDVFAAGDTIAFAARELPKSGVYAVRAGPVLADNIRRTLTGKPLRPFRPQREALYLVSTGERQAIGHAQRAGGRRRLGVALEGLDRPPLHAQVQRSARDGRGAVAPLLAAGRPAGARGKFPPSPCAAAAAAPRSAPPCSRARWAGSSRAPRADVVVGLDAPDDAALVDVGGDRLSLQTVDYFRAIVDDPYTLGKIAANHSLGDVYAMGGEPQTALAIATVPYGLEAKVEADSVGDDGGRQRGAARGRLRARRRPHQRRRRAGARLRRQRARRARRRAAQRRARAGRRAHPDQADRNRHAARRRHARQGKGALGDGGDRAHDPIERPARPRSCAATASMPQPT